MKRGGNLKREENFANKTIGNFGYLINPSVPFQGMSPSTAFGMTPLELVVRFLVVMLGLLNGGGR
jgi:hypothetical protein